MVRVFTHIFQIVVFTRNPQTWLAIGYPSILNRTITQKEILELIHPGIGEEQGWITLDQQGGRRCHMVPFGCKEVQKGLAYVR